MCVSQIQMMSYTAQGYLKGVFDKSTELGNIGQFQVQQGIVPTNKHYSPARTVELRLDAEINGKCYNRCLLQLTRNEVETCSMHSAN